MKAKNILFILFLVAFSPLANAMEDAPTWAHSRTPRPRSARSTVFSRAGSSLFNESTNDDSKIEEELLALFDSKQKFNSKKTGALIALLNHQKFLSIEHVTSRIHQYIIDGANPHDESVTKIVSSITKTERKELIEKSLNTPHNDLLTSDSEETGRDALDLFMGE